MAASSVPARRAALQDPEVAARAARRWWLFLITGSLWMLFSLIVFRFDIDSVTAVGIAVGALCFAAGVNEFLTLGATSGGWKVVRVILAVLFVVIGVRRPRLPPPDVHGGGRDLLVLPRPEGRLRCDVRAS